MSSDDGAPTSGGWVWKGPCPWEPHTQPPKGSVVAPGPCSMPWVFLICLFVCLLAARHLPGDVLPLRHLVSEPYVIILRGRSEREMDRQRPNWFTSLQRLRHWHGFISLLVSTEENRSVVQSVLAWPLVLRSLNLSEGEIGPMRVKVTKRKNLRLS